MPGLKYVPLLKQNSSRGWKNTIAIETIIELLEEKFPEFEHIVNKVLKEKYDKIRLKNFNVKITYYSEGKAEIINA